jgi:hypothetical protein
MGIIDLLIVEIKTKDWYTTNPLSFIVASAHKTASSAGGTKRFNSFHHFGAKWKN